MVEQTSFSVFMTKPLKWNPWSGAISFIEKTESSHACISFHSQDYDRAMVIHSKLFNVHMLPTSEFIGTSEFTDVYHFSVPADKFKAAMRVMSDDVGAGYAYWQLPFMAIMRLFKIQSRFDDPGMTCSELVAKFLYSGIIDEKPEMDFCDYGLVELKAVLDKHGKRIK